MTLSHIVAVSSNDVIGVNNTLPWNIPEDMKFFREKTKGKALIMGRKTFDALPGLLPGRRHVVLTRQKGWSAPGTEVAHSLEEALALAGDGDIAVIGGNDVVELFMPLATRLEITEVHEDTAGDVFMAAPGPEWREVAREEHPAQGTDPAYAFVTLEKSASGAGERTG